MSKAKERYISWLYNTKWYHDPAVIDYIKELEQQKAELIEALQESNKELHKGRLCLKNENRYYKNLDLLNKYKER